MLAIVAGVAIQFRRPTLKISGVCEHLLLAMLRVDMEYRTWRYADCFEDTPGLLDLDWEGDWSFWYSLLDN